MRRLVMVLLVSAGCVACSDPPQKEYHQAQGAIEAARAAGAEQFAAAELAQAEAALRKYDDAVAQRDYRQALTHALDARERASAAAKKSAADKASIRGEVERAIAALAADAQRARDAAAGVRRPDAAVRTLKQVVADTDRALQEARAALERDDVRRAREVLNGLQDRLTQALAPFTQPPPAPPQRRR